jgi:hypothetical protein
VRHTEVLEANDDGSPHRARFVDAKVSEIHYVIEYRYVDYDITWHLLEGDMISQLERRSTACTRPTTAAPRCTTPSRWTSTCRCPTS